ncbi:MAG: Rieske 2Fe-2S domain-containing protein [Opitutales bacterium]
MSPTTSPPRDCTFTDNDWHVLSRFWYPVARVEELSADKPFAARLLDEDLIVYRSGDGCVVAKDLCIHRGVPLSLGRLEGEEVVCAYHGFRYGKEGQCTRIPAAPEASIPKKLCLQTFPVEERYGMIWTCLAGADAAVEPIPDWPEPVDLKLRHVKLPPQRWQAAATRQVENFNDVAHLSWLHVGTFGNRDRPEVDRYKVTPTEHGFAFDVPYHYSGRADGKTEGVLLYNYRMHMPFYTRLVVNYDNGTHYWIFDLAVPESATRTRVYFQVAMDFDLDGPDQPVLDFQEAVLSEDRPMVESQRPEELPLDLSEEFHIRADSFSTQFRRKLKKLGLGSPMTA